MLNHFERVYANVDLNVLEENLLSLKAHCSENTKLIAVVKADGYGHGALPIAKFLDPLDYIYGFAAATAEEALSLRDGGVTKPIIILGYTFPSCYREMISNDIIPTVFRMDMAELLNEEAKKQNKKVKIHVKVDTGMKRIGIRPDEEGILFLHKLMCLDYISIEGIFTHFATADCSDYSGAVHQYHIFRNFVKRAEEELHYHFPVKHCSNSAGIMCINSDMDVVRAGIAMYGLWPSDEMDHFDYQLKPVFTLMSKIVFTKTIYPGEKVSYGGHFTAEKEMRIATIPVGYGDGYPRALSGKGYVLIHGEKAPILGRICMDQFMVDISHISSAKEGDYVTLIGKDGSEELLLNDLCNLYGGFHYEVMCNFDKRIPKIYRLNGKNICAMEYDKLIEL